MSTKHQPCGKPGCINCWAPATGFDGQAAPHNPWHTEHLHPLQKTLRDNGDLIAAQATIAQQAQMIEHLRGGPTPGFTAVDMATAAADGFRDGVASHWQPMETCPKHKDVLFYREDAGVFTGQLTYCETFMSEKEVEDSDYDEQTLYSEDAFSFGPDGAYRCDGDLVPTHWMSFPPEPEAKP